MSDHALTQVEDRLQTLLAGYAPLDGWRVEVAESLDVAIELDPDEAGVLLITTTAYAVDVFELGGAQTKHDAVIDIEAISGTASVGTISRANRNALALVIAAIAPDRSLGIGLQDIQEDDIAPAEPRGKDVSAASLRFRVQFFTSRSDWFTIV